MSRPILWVVLSLTVLWPPAPAFADKPCEQKCQQDWPRTWLHAIPRKACLAKCLVADKARAAGKTLGQVGATVVDTGKKILDAGKRAVDAAKKVVETGKKVVVDTARRVAADTGKRILKVVQTGKRLYDFGKCLSGAGWKAAIGCLSAKETCRAEIIKSACPCIAPHLGGWATALLNEIGGRLSKLRVSLSGKQLAALACTAGSRDLARYARRAGDLTLTLRDVELKATQGTPNGVTAKLTAIAELTKPGKKDALTLTAGGQISVGIDDKCNFQDAALTLRPEVTTVSIGELPAWLAGEVYRVAGGSIAHRYPLEKTIRLTVPDLPPMPSKMQALFPKSASQFGLCDLLDFCLKQRCGLTVATFLLHQLFPYPLSDIRDVPERIRGWKLELKDERLRVEGTNPYRVSLSGKLGAGPPKGERTWVEAAGALQVRTRCAQRQLEVAISLKAKKASLSAGVPAKLTESVTAAMPKSIAWSSLLKGATPGSAAGGPATGWRRFLQDPREFLRNQFGPLQREIGKMLEKALGCGALTALDRR